MRNANHRALGARTVGMFVGTAVAVGGFLHGLSVQANNIAIQGTDVVNNWTLVDKPISGMATASNSHQPIMIPPVAQGDIQTNNSGGATVSDFEVLGDFTLTAEMYVYNGTQDDAFGLMWNYQPDGSHYRFSWDKFDKNGGLGDETGLNGVANYNGQVHGMRVLKDTPVAGDTGNGSQNMFYYQEDAVPGPTPWTPNQAGITSSYQTGWDVRYEIEVTRTGNDFSVMVGELGGPTLLSTTFMDANALDGGKIGFFSDHMGTLVLSDIEYNQVPEPSAGLLGILGLLGLIGSRRSARFMRRVAGDMHLS